MADETKWCTLCQRYIVPKKEFNSIGWVGFVAGAAYLVAAMFNEPLARSIMNNTLAAALATGIGNIMLNVLLLLVAPLVLISIIYCLYYSAQFPRCPICNSQSLMDRTKREGISTHHKGEERLGQGDMVSSAKAPIPIKTPHTPSLDLQWPSLDLKLPSLVLKWLTNDPLISFLSIVAGISVIVVLIFYALASGLIRF